MITLSRTLSLRYLLRRYSRTVLVVLSIALGVAALVATRSLNQNMSAAAHAAYTPMAGIADLFVTSPSGVPRDLIKSLRETNIPGVAALRPLLLQRVLLPELDNLRALVVGLELDPSAANPAADNPWGVKINQTKALTTAEYLFLTRVWGQYPAFLGADLNAALPKGSTTLKVKSGGDKPKTIALYGTVEAHGPAAALGGQVIYLPLEDAATIANQGDKVTRIDVVLTPGAEVEEVQARLQEQIGTAARVLTPEANNARVQDLLGGIEISFTLGGVCALVVGLFLVYNALSVSVTERRHDIGILRSLGATRFQVAALFTGEALLLGLIGSTLGVPLGWVFAYLAQGSASEMMTDLFGVRSPGLPPLGWPLIVVAVVCGMATALVAGLVPAIQASREEPADAVRRAPLGSNPLGRMVHAAVAAAILLAGLMCLPLQDYLPPKAAVFAAPVLVLVGMLVATPLLAGGLARLLQQPARWFFGVPERLAADNLARSPGRTGLVIAALAAGVALMVQTAGVMQSSEDGILTWLDRTIAADLFVTANSPVTSAGNAQPMSDRLREEIAAQPEVRKVVPVRFRQSEHNGQVIYIVAVNAADFIDRERVPDPLPGMELFPHLTEPGTALVSENFAALHHVKAGDTIELPGHQGPMRLKVIGSMLDYTWNRGAVFVDRSQYMREFGDGNIDVLNVYLHDGADSEAVRKAMLSRWGAEESLVVLTRSETKEGLRGQVQKLYGFGYAQEVVVGLVAGLGVMMALLISVLQRRRELGLLRAVGASQGQVLRTVLAEAMLMGLVGSFIGLAFGIPLEWYMIRVLLLQEAGFFLPVTIPWTASAVVIGLALLLATLAGLGPAIHAVRLRIADAIAYE